MTFATVVMTTDFSECADVAMEYAFALARSEGAELVIVHVLEPRPSYAMYGMDLVLPPEVDTQVRASAEQQLAGVADKIPAEICRRMVIRVGSVASEVAALCAGLDSPLVVLATHGHSGWRQFMIGSSAERIARELTCPVMLIPGPSNHAD